MVSFDWIVIFWYWLFLIPVIGALTIDVNKKDKFEIICLTTLIILSFIFCVIRGYSSTLC